MSEQNSSSQEPQINKTKEEQRVLEEKHRLLEEEKIREEYRKKKELEEMRKLEMEREYSRKRREQRSPTLSRAPVGCYKTNKINIHKPIKINKSHIKHVHVITVEGYLRELFTHIKTNISDDIQNEIVYFYAKPIVLKLKLNPMFLSSRERKRLLDSNKDIIKCVLYCPVDDEWHNLLSTVRNTFNLSLWTNITAFSYMNQNDKILIDENTWNHSRKFMAVKWKADDIIEIEERRQKEDEYIRKHFPEMIDTSSEDESSSSDETSSTEEAVLTVKEMLKHFDKIAAIGQLFMKYDVGENEPRDVIIKLRFSNKYKPVKILWGSIDDGKFIDVDDILYIGWGHWTPVFSKYKDIIDPKLCFSVVGRNMILDIQGATQQLVELWVKGLRKMIGQTDNMAERLCRQGLENYQMQSKKLNDKKENKKDNWDENILIIGGIVVIGIVLVVVLNRKRFFR